MVDTQGVFIVGAPRSSTSAMAWALAQHPDLWTSEESDWMLPLFGSGRLVEAYAKGTRRGDRHWLGRQKVSFEEWAAAMGSGIDALYRSRSRGQIWVEQTPRYVHMARELAALFPRARFLHLVRRGDQVVRSLLASGFDIQEAKDFAVACRTWASHVAAGLEFQAECSERCLEVRHADLVRDPEAEMDRILAFLGLDSCGDCAALLRRRAVNSSFAKPASGTRPEASDRPREEWSRSERSTFDGIAGDLMRQLGFD